MTQIANNPDGTGPVFENMATLYTILLPLLTNDGYPQEPAHMEQMCSSLFDFAGGLTSYSTCQGIWRTPAGHICQEPIKVVQVVVPSSTEAQRWFSEWLYRAAILLDQEVIFAFSLEVLIGESTVASQ